MNNSSPKKLKIGCDIGGVVMRMFSEDSVVGAFEGIECLMQEGHPFIFISKCGESFQSYLVKWLQMNNLGHIQAYFCKSYDGKIGIANSQKIDIMIDDKIQVLRTFPSTIKCLWFCDDAKKISSTKKHQPELFETLHLVGNWNEVLDLISEFENQA